MIEYIAITTFSILAVAAFYVGVLAMRVFFEELNHKNISSALLPFVVVLVMAGNVYLAIHYILRIIEEGIT